MSKLILMVGATAAGKSTYAKQHMGENDVLASRDEIRFQLYDETRSFYDSEKIVFPVFIYQIVTGLKQGKTVWVEALNNTLMFRAQVLSEIERYVRADELEVYFMDTPLEVCIERNIARGGPAQLPDEQVVGFHSSLVPPTLEEFLQRGYQKVTIHTIKT